MKEKNGLLQKIVGAVGIALCVVFVPLLLINVTLIVCCVSIKSVPPLIA